MKSDKKTGKRGRPKKIQSKIEEIKTKPLVVKKDGVEIDLSTPVVVETTLKRKRGRPAKSGVVKGEMNIVIKSHDVIVEEEYIQPKIMRKKRVFRFDKRVFHQFANKYEGDIVVMSYVHDRLMRLYVDNKIDIPKINETYYSAWHNGSPPIEPIEENEIALHNAVIKGIPIQYKYSLLIDEDMFTRFEKYCKRYPQYISNELVKMLLDEKNGINIDTSKYREWCMI